MGRGLAAILLVSAAATTAPAGAVAQDEPSPEDVERARETFESAREAYEAGDYEAALAGFRETYRLTQNFEILYNIAQCADRLRRDDVALEAYRAYLEGQPAEQDRAQVEARIAVIERNLAEEEGRIQRELEERERRRAEEAALREQLERERAAAEEARRNRPDPPPDPGAAPWLVLGAGGAVAAAGIVLVVLAELDAACVTDPTGCVQDPANPSWGEVSDRYARIEGLRVAGWSSLGLGVAAAIAGLTWALVSQSARDSFEVVVGPATVGLRGSFR